MLYDKAANEMARQARIKEKIAFHRPHWDAVFGKDGKSTYGETLEEWIESVYPAGFYYLEER